MKFRPYDSERDHAAVVRIWHEVGWGEAGENKSLDTLLPAVNCRVAEVNGSAEGLVVTAPGDIDYMGARLPFSAVLGVTSGLVARRGGVASRLTAHSIAADAAAGAAVTALGIFDQGYYNRLGFGNGTSELYCRFDPRTLRVPPLTRTPIRLTKDDVERMHAARMARMRTHGSLNLFSSAVSLAAMLEQANTFGLGFTDDSGELTHFLGITGLGREHGPFEVHWTVYRTGEQFIELMSVLHSLSDQIHQLAMMEPPLYQLQDLLAAPMYDHEKTRGGKFEDMFKGLAWWQIRMVDVPRCIAAVCLPGAPVRFNLTLCDPIERYLDEDEPWRGVSGNYVITLGERSEARPGQEPGLPLMTASVNAFTRMWLGIRSATGLAVTDDLAAPQPLLSALDALLRLPRPHLDWPI